MALTLPTDNRTALWSKPHGGWGSFRPHGRRSCHGKRYQPNKKTWSGGQETWSSRLFVGFNVGPRTEYEMADLIAIVRRVREAQTGDPSSTFVSQRGIYKHQDSGLVVEEPGGQVIIISPGTSPDAFTGQMVELAEEIAEELDQEEVVVEIQRRGIVQDVFGVSAG